MKLQLPPKPRIVISRLKYIGDIVLTTPILRAVREKYPDAHITYLGDAKGIALLENNSCLDEIIPFDFDKATLIEQPRVIFKLRSLKPDVFIDLFCNPRSAMLAYLSGARIRIGKEVRGRGKLYTHRITDDGKPKSAIKFHFAYVEPIGVEPTTWKTEIVLTDAEKRDARIFLKWQDIDLERPVVALHPGATWNAKKWNKEYFAELIDLLNAKLRAQVVITQGPKDAEVVNEVSKLAVGNATVLPVMPLRQLAAILSCCNCFVTNDCGPMHISVAVGTPTIGIFGSGEEETWFPYVPPYYPADAKHIALRKDVPCHPCHLNDCNRAGDGFMECMKLLKPREVLDVISSIIAKT
ncbi:MAG TPA: glycosyltransferase family 9 protein [Bacteroidota bacterium]|nr:glycosyltransferase family 9 protein [Bacteroidota bacterium]